MKKTKILFAILFAVFAIPSLAYAAWWNPLTWFKKSANPPKAVQVQVGTTTTATKTPASATTPKTAKETAVVKPKVTPPPKIIDPSAEIEKLKKEVAELKESQTRTAEPSESQKPVISPSSNAIPQLETREEQETRDFLYADQKGWTNLISTNALGEKRYYRKEGIQWVRKNSEAEALQTYESPESIALQVAFRDDALGTYTRLISILANYRNMFTIDIDGMSNIARLISDSGTADERFLWVIYKICHQISVL